MAKKFVKRWMPDVHSIRTHKNLQFLGKLLHDPNLWHLNRRSASGAVAVGLFMAFLPIPLQMAPAAILAIWLRVNLPIAVALVWITNPLTIAPVFYFTYKLGSWMLGRAPDPVSFEMSLAWFKASVNFIWQPFLLGSLTLSTVSALLGYLLLRFGWQLHVTREWRRRKERRAKSENPPLDRKK